MDLRTILPLVAGAAIGSLATIGAAILTLASGWFSKRAQNRRNATYLAARLAVILERFAIECCNRIERQELHESSRGAAGITSDGPLPELQPFPDAPDWSALQSDLMDRVLVLPNECLLANGAIAVCWDVQNDYVPAECLRQYGKVGYMAWALSGDLRRRYRVLAFNPEDTAKGIGVLLKRYRDEALRVEDLSKDAPPTDDDDGVGRIVKTRTAWAKWRLETRLRG